MACTDHMSHIDEQLSAYIDGEVAPEERRQIEEHLKTCQQCRQACERLREIAELASESLRSARCLSAADKVAYIHHLMDEPQRRRAEEHLSRCHNCRTEIEELKTWVAERLEPDEHAEVSPKHKKRYKTGRFVGFFFPLAAAAAFVICLISGLLSGPAGPAITRLNVLVAATRSPDDPGKVSVNFGEERPLHTNDQIQLFVDAGDYTHVVIFGMSPAGDVHLLGSAPFSDPAKQDIALPSPANWWRLGSTVGTDAIFVVFAKKPLGGDVIKRAEQALSQAGPPPQLPYGSIAWLDQKGRRTSDASARLDTLLAALKQTLAGHDVVCRGVAFAHE